jgi:hypothetical protein
VGFQKLASLPLKRLRELEKETLQIFKSKRIVEIQHFRQSTEAEGNYQRFLSWLETHIRETGERLFGSSRIQTSALGTMLMCVTAAESRFESFTGGSNIFDQDQPILDELRQHELLCSEILFRYHRLPLADSCTYLEAKEEFAVFTELWKKVITKAAGVLFSAPPSIGDIGNILESLKWYLQMSGDSFLYYHFQSEAPSVTIPGCMRDILGRTAAHQWLDGVRPCQWSESCLDQFKDVINFKMQDLDDQDFLGRTLLHIACEQRWYRGVVWLLDQGVNPGIVTGYGSLPLHYAAAYGSSFICELLFFYQLKFDIHAKDNAQLSALDYATAFNYEDVIELFSRESFGKSNRTATDKATTTDTTVRENHHESHEIAASETSLIRAQLGSTMDSSDAVFGEHPTTNNMYFTTSASSASQTLEPADIIKPLVVVIGYIFSKSLYCDMDDVQVVSAVMQKLHQNSDWMHDLPGIMDPQPAEFIYSMQVLVAGEAKLRRAPNPLLPITPSEDVVTYTVLTAMRYAQYHVEGLIFEKVELEVVAKLMMDAVKGSL